MANPHLIIPAGTQVVVRRAVTTGAGAPVCPAGAVGTVTAAPTDPTHAYRVRLPSGAEVSLRRDELGIRKHVQAGPVGDPGGVLRERGLYEHVVYRCVVGSRAYGLDGEASDVDVRGVYLPPAEAHWSLYGVPEQLESPETEEVYWEAQKFVVLALKANPNILECLYTPLVERVEPVTGELLRERGRFLSKVVYQTYNGYVMSQFRRLEADFRADGAPRWKHAMHLVRLLIAGVTILREGHVPVRVETHRDALLCIKRGEVPWPEVDAWRLSLHREFDAAYASTKLPERPDYDWANDWLVRARRSVVGSA
ncbi:MAG TPA: nucleotidyltransferase domain-containing protein [Longimicrobiaceae bacterium]|nr:nucleotidyltransferase domain-containing protein [Longimicrobiaceae bacterium]